MREDGIGDVDATLNLRVFDLAELVTGSLQRSPPRIWKQQRRPMQRMVRTYRN
jgi:hypothetical protein